MNITVDVKLQVTSHEFTPALADNTTQEYKQFTNSFKLQMKVVYYSVQGYKDVIIVNLMQGSVIVDHYVVLALPVTEELNTNFEEVTKQLKTEIDRAAQNQNCNSNLSVMCFDASSASVTMGTLPTFNGTEYCQKAAPEGYSRFYFPYLTKSGLSCISNCTKDTPGFLNCNYGQCQLTRAGPQCFLHSADTDIEKWYENDSSEWSTGGSFCIRNKGADPGKDPDSTGSFAINLASVDSTVPVHIQRPEIIVTQL